MNRRKAKKKVKRMLHISKWPGNLEPRLVLMVHQEMSRRIAAALDHAILYGSSKPFVF